MTLPVVVNPDAQADLADVRDWYDRQRPGGGNDFIARVDQTLAAIGRMPGMYADEFQALRRGPVRRFPYAVVYRIDPGQITVVAVYHNHRDPAGWQARA